MIKLEIADKRLFMGMNVVMLVYAAISLYRMAQSAIYAITLSSSWEVTEFLINYRGGYVRRGLVGEILYHITKAFPTIDPRFYIVAICVFSFLLLIGVLVVNFRQNKLCWWVLPLNICLSGAFFLFRKDFLCALLVMLALFLYTKSKTHVVRILAVSASLVVTLNVHECVFFMIVPFMVLLYWKESGYSWRHRVVGIGLLLVFMGVVCLYKGDRQIASVNFFL